MIRFRRTVLAMFLFVSIAAFGLPGMIDGTFSALTDKENINGSAKAGYWNGTIKIVKDVNPDQGDAQLFTFTPTGGSLASFTLQDNNNEGDGQASSKTMAGLTPGVYTFTEDALNPVTFDITAISCQITDTGGTDTPTLSTILYKGGPNDTSTYEAGDNQVEITLQGGDIVECTFENTKRAEVIVDKVTNPNTDTTLFDFTVKDGANADVDSFQLAHATAPHSTFVKPGNNYSVTETAVTGWNTAVACTGGLTSAADLDLDAGEVVTCTFTNTKLGSITIVKDDTKNSQTIFDFTAASTPPATTLVPNDFDLEDDGNLADGAGQQPSQAFSNLMPGVYTFTELAEDDYEVTLINCVNSSGGTSTFKYLGDSQVPITDGFGEGDNKAEVTLVAGSNVTCTFTNEPTTGTIVIKKVTVPNSDSEQFDFDSNIPGNTDFDLAHGGTKTMSDLEAPPVSPYTVTETAEAGWVITNISCTDPGDSVVLYLGGADAGTNLTWEEGDNQVSIDLEPSETVECTFTNSRLPTLQVVKQLNPEADTGKFVLKIDDTEYNNGGSGYGDNQGPAAVILQPGSHTVTELGHGSTVLTDYKGQIVCNSGKGSTTLGDIQHTFNLAYGDVVTCTITNNRLPQIEVKKVLDPTSDTSKFDLIVDGVTMNNGGPGYGHTQGTGFITVPTGQNIVVGEAKNATGPALSAYSQSISCDNGYGGNSNSATYTITNDLEYGEKVTCTVTNTKKASLTVKKTVVNNSPSFLGKQASDFSIHVKTGGVDVGGSPAAGNSTTGTTYLLAPGNYVVSEANNFGYTLVISGDCANPAGTITLAAGEVKTCTLTNTEPAPGNLQINKTCAYPSPLTTPAAANTLAGTLGFFTFQVNGVTKGTTNVHCGGNTGSFQVAPGVQQTVTELAGNSTSLSDFSTTYGGDCASNGTVTVASGQSKTCTVTNTVVIPAVCTTTIGAYDNLIIGTAGPETLTGDNSDTNFIIGLGGDDTLNGRNQNDCLVGGPGNDNLNGDNSGPANDVLLGGPGNDVLHGGNGVDDLFGEEGDDQLFGDNFGANCNGGPGNDEGTDCLPGAISIETLH